MTPLKLAPEEGVLARLRQVQPPVELRAAFTLSREELDAIGREAKDPRGMLDHDATTVRLYSQETFTFRVLTPEAAVPLVYPED